MRFHHCLILVLLVLFGCKSKSQPSQIKDQAKLNALTPNIVYVMSSYEDAWNATVKIIQYELLMPLEIADKEKGFFSTQIIKDYDNDPPRRFRVSGDLSSDNQETMIKIYKSEEIKYTDDQWHTRLSDYAMESEIVGKIQNALQKK